MLISNWIDVIHTVGPQSERPTVLANCYRNSLQVLTDNQLRSIAFPCIATGVYGYDNERAADVALTTVHDFLQDQLAKGQDKVRYVLAAWLGVTEYWLSNHETDWPDHLCIV